MDILIIAGFLGTGKTTLLAHAAKALSAQGKKVVIIENEVGKVGIDDLFLREEGLAVREIYSGCICCSLRVDLITTLLELERDYRPDIVLLEPSGVAGPRQVLDCMLGYGGEIENKKIVVLIDALRFGKLKDLSIPIIKDGIAIADIVIINKIDQVTASDLAMLKERIKSLRPDAVVVCISALNETDIKALMPELLQLSMPERPAVIAESADANAPMPHAVTHAGTFTLRFSQPVEANVLSDELSAALSRLSKLCCRGDSDMLGHIKAIVQARNEGYLLLSCVSGNAPVQIKGKLAPMISHADLTINAILYDLPKHAVDQAVSAELTAVAARFNDCTIEPCVL
jgi:G3E family GTPase